MPLTCVHPADCHQHHRGQAAGRRKHRPQCGDWVWRWEETHFGQRRDQRSLLQWGRAQLDLKLELKKTSGRMLQSNYKLLIILSLSLLSISILCLTPLPIKKSSSTKLSSWQWVELTKTSLGHSWFFIVTSFYLPCLCSLDLPLPDSLSRLCTLKCCGVSVSAPLSWTFGRSTNSQVAHWFVTVEKETAKSCQSKHSELMSANQRC